MAGSDNFVITIGNYGAVVASHDKNKIVNKILLEELNQENKQKLTILFNQNKDAFIYVLLDTINQTYKKKSYPAVKKSDLALVIKRDMDQDDDKEGLKSHILLNKKLTATRRWECLFVSSASSDIITDWIKFLLDMPNHFVGIYMLPVESFSLFSLLKSNIRLNSKISLKRNDLYCLILQNKVSGIRQIVFSEASIVFTRVVNYDFNAPDFIEKYEQDLYSTFEYLKRLFPELLMAELDIVNIFPKEVLDKIKKISNVELNFINYTPYQASTIANAKGLIPEDSNYCDLLISRVFSRSKRKVLKFDTPKIKTLQRFFYLFKFSKYLNITLLVATCIVGLNILLLNQKLNSSIVEAEKKQSAALKNLQKVESEQVRGKNSEENNIDQIVDMGKVHEVLGKIDSNFVNTYSKLSILKSYDVVLSSFVYNFNNFNPKAENKNLTYRVDINGKLNNKSGSVEDLFTGFDGMIAVVKQAFDKEQVQYTDLPRNIDFAKKYYDSTVQITIQNQ